MSHAGRSAPLAPACFAAALLTTIPALAGRDDADVLFDAGVLQMEAGRYEQGCPSIEHSYRIDPRPGVLFTLAECEAKRGRLAAAVARYGEYLALYETLPRPKKKLQGTRPAAAKTALTSLSPRVPRLALSLAPGAPASAVVERDGQVVDAATLGTPVPVDPGDHVLRTSVKGGSLTEIHVTIAPGESRRVVLDVKVPPPIPAPKPEERRVPSGRRIVAYVLGGAGLAGLAVGGALGGAAIARKSVVNGHCNLGGIPEACDHEGKAAADQLGAFALGSTTGLVAGGALALTSIVLLVTEPSAPKPPTSARWMSVSGAPAPGGATVLLQGTF